jgi:membrane-associated HD superfamily phosphohydrolase
MVRRRKNDVNNFNDFLDNANNVLACDANCQERKKKEELKTKYLEAKTNLLTAPNQVDSSYKNYLTYTKGDSAYSEYKENELKQKAQTIVTTFKSNFSESIEKIKESYDTYVGLLLNFTHVV